MTSKPNDQSLSWAIPPSRFPNSQLCHDGMHENTEEGSNGAGEDVLKQKGASFPRAINSKFYFPRFF